jgi:hypothetical protein
MSRYRKLFGDPMSECAPIYSLTKFTPSEAERITGVAVDLQRVWRKRGFLPKVEGHARFDLISLAEMKALKALFDFGRDDFTRSRVAPVCARAISHEVLTGIYHKVFEGNWEKWWGFAMGLKPEKNHPYWRESADDRFKFVRDYYHHRAASPTEGEFAYSTINDLGRYIFYNLDRNGRFGTQVPVTAPTSALAVITSDGQLYGVNNIDGWSSNTDLDVQQALRRGGGLLIDHELFAQDIVQTAGRALVSVQIPEVADA